jgi:hypothetical protein
MGDKRNWSTRATGVGSGKSHLTHVFAMTGGISRRSARRSAHRGLVFPPGKSLGTFHLISPRSLYEIISPPLFFRLLDNEGGGDGASAWVNCGGGCIDLSSTGSAAAAAQGVGSCSAAEERSGDLPGQRQRSSAAQCVGSLAAASQRRSAVVTSQGSGSAARQRRALAVAAQRR